MDEPIKKEQKPVVKKPYSPPTLTIFGTVQEVTKAVGLHGNLDGGAPSRNRTHI
jgi:hypothetical protein